MFYLLALLSAALYGAADFLGGLASRRTNTIAIVVMSQAAGLLLLLLILPLLPDASPSRADLLWGAAAGLAGGIGVGLLYRALAVGTMAVVAPTTAVCAVMIPVMADVLLGERLATLTMFGIGLALVAIVLVSRQTVARTLSPLDAARGALSDSRRAGSRGGPEAGSPPRTPARWGAVARPTANGALAGSGVLPSGVGLALVSGVAIGLFFLALARTNAAAGMWPLVAARVVSVTLFGIIGVVSSRPLRMPAPVVRIAVAAGVVDMVANALYLAATRYGPLSVVVTLSSLYPASTSFLARIALGERLNGWQATGIACALVAVVLIVSTG